MTDNDYNEYTIGCMTVQSQSQKSLPGGGGV